MNVNNLYLRASKRTLLYCRVKSGLVGGVMYSGARHAPLQVWWFDVGFLGAVRDPPVRGINDC
jgi:hypothetical protein